MASNADVMRNFGEDWRLKVIRIVPETICYGIYLVLMGALFTILYRRGLALRRSNIFLMFVTILMFIGSTIFLACDVADLLGRMEIFLLKDLNETDYNIKLDRANEVNAPLFRTEVILFIFMLSLGDCVVVWRTWAICVGRRSLVLIPIATLAGSAVSAIFELGCDLKTGWASIDLSPKASPTGAILCKHADISSFTLSYVTNIFCTGLIAYQTWEHRRLMANYLGAERRKTQVEKLLVLILESGFVYIVLYTTQAVPIYGVQLSPTGLVICNVFNAIIQQAMGMYPTLIIILVRMEKSVWDAHEISTHIQSSNMQFAAREGLSRGTVVIIDDDTNKAFRREQTKSLSDPEGHFYEK